MAGHGSTGPSVASGRSPQRRSSFFAASDSAEGESDSAEGREDEPHRISASELSRQLSNPVTSLWSIQFQFNNYRLENGKWNNNLLEPTGHEPAESPALRCVVLRQGVEGGLFGQHPGRLEGAVR